MRKEGMILIWQAEGQVDGASAVFSGADVVSNKLAAVPVVIGEFEARQLPQACAGARCCCGDVLPGDREGSAAWLMP